VRALVKSNLGCYFHEAGDDATALELIDEGLELGERAGNRRFHSEALTYRAKALARLADLVGAENAARRALELATESGSVIDEGVSSRVLGAVCARRGAMDADVAKLFERSRACLAGTDPFEHARTHAAEARWMQSRGRAYEAKDRRTRARQVFERLGAARDLELLDDLHVIR
jgi:tetratricopeptide (TPR) repeat protein